MEADDINKTADKRKHSIYFKINNNVSFVAQDLPMYLYIRLKHDDNEALEYVMQQMNCGKINLSENQIRVLHRSIDDVDYTQVAVPTTSSIHSDIDTTNVSDSETDYPNIGASNEVASTKNLVCDLKTKFFKKSSLVWKHFIKKPNNTAECKYCEKTLKHAGNTTNLMQHLNRKHEVLYKSSDEIRSKKQSTDEAPPAKKRKLQATTLSRSNSIDAAFTHINDLKSGGSRFNQITNALLYMIAIDQLPLSTVNKEGFKYFMKIAAPLYDVPSRKTITHLVEIRYTQLKEKMKLKLKEASSYTLTADIWTDVNMQAYLGVTAHYLSKTKTLNSGCLGVLQLSQNHTADYIAESFLSIISDFDLEMAKITAVVTDGAANMKKGMRSVVGTSKHLVCFAHTVSRVVESTLSALPIVTDIISKVKDIVTLTRRSTVASDELKRLQIRDGKSEGTALKFIQDCPTRWNSTLHMLERFLLLEQYVYGTISKCSNAPNMLQREEIIIVKDIVSMMKPIESVITEISGSKYSTCSIIIPIIHCMQASIIHVNLSTSIGEQFKKILLNEIEQRFYNFEQNMILAVSTIMDPRFKKIHFESALAAANAIAHINQHICANKTTNVTKAMKTTKDNNLVQEGLWTFHNMLVAKNKQFAPENDETLNAELKHYLGSPVVSRYTNPLEYWENSRNTSPNLYSVAIQYCSVIATSVPCERLFSVAGNIKNDNRSRLTGLMKTNR